MTFSGAARTPLRAVTNTTDAQRPTSRGRPACKRRRLAPNEYIPSSPTEEEKKEAHFKKKLEACGQYDEPSAREVKLLASKAKRDHDRGAAMRRPRWERMKLRLSR